MKPLRNFLDKIKPNFQKGGKFEKLHTTFDALDTFLFVPNRTTSVGAHIRDGIDLKRTMITVIIAMVPALLFGMWNVGHQHFLSMGKLGGLGEGFWDKFLFGLQIVLPIIIISYASGLTVEFIFATYRGHSVNEGFLVTGMLIPLVMPPSIPLWMVAVATIFSVIFAKEAFGGTGMNILNVALVARAFIFFAYPAQISGSIMLDGGYVWIETSKSIAIDGYSGATPLAVAAEAIASKPGIDALLSKMPSLSYMFLGFMPGCIGETSKLAILIGALILIVSGIGSWRVMLAILIGTTGMGLLFNAIGVNDFMKIPFYYHFLMGGFMFGLVFMATDPVTAAQTNKGKWIYGIFVGIMVMLIRIINPAYPEGMMLAILLGNVFAPLFDHYVIEANIKKRTKVVKAVVKKENAETEILTT